MQSKLPDMHPATPGKEPSGIWMAGPFPLLLQNLPRLQKVQIAGLGEPLCHPDLMAMIEGLKRKANQVELISNGLLLDRETALSFLEVGLDRLILSIDGSRAGNLPANPGRQPGEGAGQPGKADRTKKGRGCSHPQIGCELVAMKDNIDELPALIKLLQGRGVEFLIVTNVLPYTTEMKDQVLYRE